MKFSDPQTSRTYSDRTADSSWKDWCTPHLSPADKDVVDIGCGGGIYSFGFADLGARSVIGIDQSHQYLDEAKQAAGNAQSVLFQKATASITGLASGCADIVFERALIHHLTSDEMRNNAREARRLLRRQGILCVQDRTFEDVQATQAAFWIRSTLIDAFPRLLEFEKQRRPSESVYSQILEQSGFTNITVLAYHEVRKSYPSFDALEAEILSRKGKSILFELSDGELRSYCDILRSKSADHPLTECDRWTVWLASE